MPNTIRAKIMRRIYYSYLLSIFSQSIFWQGVFLSVAIFLLGQWLHVASIIDNFLSLSVRDVPRYVADSFLGAISQGEIITAATLVLALWVTISVSHHLASVLKHKPSLRLANQP